MKDAIYNKKAVYGRMAYLFDTATDDELAAGLEWYDKAKGMVVEWSVKYGFDPLTVAGVVSALSPSVSWDRNVVDAENLLRAVSCGETDARNIVASTYPAQVEKAVRIAWTQNPEHVGNGLKTVSFFCNIAGIWDTSAVTVDRHMLGAAVGSRTTEHQKIAVTDKRYFAIADAIKALARNRNVLPKQAQAVIWTTYRRRIGLN